MTSHQRDLCILFIEYGTAVPRLFDLNPGIGSRIARHFTFHPPLVEHIVAVAESVVNQRRSEFALTTNALSELASTLDHYSPRERAVCGNLRVGRAVIEDAVIKRTALLPTEELDNLAKSGKPLTLDGQMLAASTNDIFTRQLEIRP